MTVNDVKPVNGQNCENSICFIPYPPCFSVKGNILMNGKWGTERARRGEAVSCLLFNGWAFHPPVLSVAEIWLWNQGVG